MPEFFIPRAPDPDKAEHIWQATKTYQETEGGMPDITDRRIFRLDYVHDGKHMDAEVGVPHPYGKAVDWDEFREVGEPQEVIVILEREGGLFLVCTWDRGVKRGGPILVGAGEPYQVTYFDGYGPDD